VLVDVGAILDKFVELRFATVGLEQEDAALFGKAKSGRDGGRDALPLR
jgi:hypothetical protein